MSDAAPKPRPRVETMLKWVGAVTAVLSLIAGGFTVTRLLADVQERERFIAEALAVGERQQAARDYAAAWATYEAALRSADEGGQFAKLTGRLSEPRQALRRAQAELAMVWVRNLSVPGGGRFSDTVDRLLPALERTVPVASGADKANVLAHVGWAYFLKYRDRGGGFDPAAQYRAALDADPANPYAHAFWGHWLLWQGERGPDVIEAARAHFEAAAASDRLRGEVRALQWSALGNLPDEQRGPQQLRLVQQLRRSGEPLLPAMLRTARTVYERMVRSRAVSEPLAAALPVAEHLDLLQASFGTDGAAARPAMRLAAEAMLLEAADDRAAARLRWLTVLDDRSIDPALREQAREAYRRLSAKPALGSQSVARTAHVGAAGPP